jgi:hypothetical protein
MSLLNYKLTYKALTTQYLQKPEVYANKKIELYKFKPELTLYITQFIVANVLNKELQTANKH